MLLTNSCNYRVLIIVGWVCQRKVPSSITKKMLETSEDSIKKNPNHVMMLQKEKKKRKRWTPPNGKGKEKVFDGPSSSKPKTKGKSSPTPDEECFHCHRKGYWFRNCKMYLEEQKKKKGSETSA
jgi:hypothetical protein